jgi:DHA3 family macrolide efflux protein-like MFS transporter
MKNSGILTGMRGFTFIWLGQFTSLLGSSMTNFALTIWAWEKTGTATALALTGLAFVLPNILVYPIAGALVDRWNRKLVMMISDLAAGIGTIFIFLLHISGSLQIWHLYIIFMFMGLFQSFQFPAYSAAVSTMIDKEQYGRANGMLSLARSASNVFAPIAAGILLSVVNISGILLFDVISFVIAIGTLTLVYIPQPATQTEKQIKTSLLEDSLFGFKYILTRRGLLGLQLIFFLINFTGSLCFPLLAPMILSQTGNDTVVLGTVQSAFGVGGVVGGLLLSAWGGPKKKIHGVLAGMTISSLFGITLLGLGDSVYLWVIGAFIMMVLNPIINGSNQAIWQSKVSPEIQGRVFSARAFIATISQPIAMAITGPLADGFLLPGMMDGGVLAPIFGWLVGVGPGKGISLLFLAVGLISSLVGLGAYLIKDIKNVELTLPDHDDIKCYSVIAVAE